MTFDAPGVLLLLLLVPLAVWAAVMASRRRASRARAFADPHLHDHVLRPGSPRRGAWPLGLQFAALTALLLGAAGPVAQLLLPSNQASVIIALDASRSMLADDARPSRLEAARDVAREFVRVAPASTRIGFLTFSDNASVLVAPTTDREAVLAAIDRVQPAQATSVSLAVISGVRALPGREDAVVPGEEPTVRAQPDNPNAAPADPETLAPGAILLLTDGVSNRGGNPLIAARFAADQRVKLHAVAFGEEGGAVSEIEGQLVFVPFDTRQLEQLTRLTDGRFLYPASSEQLRELYRELGTIVRWERNDLNLTGPLSGAAALLMIVAGGLMLASQRRVP